MNTVDVLREAKAILSDEAMWGHGTLVCDRTGQVCALGAIARAARISIWEPGTDPYEVLGMHPAVVALSAVLPTTPASATRAEERVYEFNDDAHPQHHARLIDAFDRAILSLTPVVEPTPEPVEVPA